uniref:Uncharacterized protein n=1 Tax=viral metagenome TaxID=1070528 RepID=A0A6C0JNS4_9ZZZZ
MNKLLLILLILVIIKLFNYKEGLCPSKCANCDYININSIINDKNGDNDCGKDCVTCTDIPISDVLKNILTKMFGTNRIYTESSERANGYGYTDTSDTTTTSSSTSTSTSSNSNTGTKSIFSFQQIKNVWADVSNGNIQPSLYSCTRDVSDNWVPYQNGESLCILDSNGIWRQYDDSSGCDDCEPVKCIADFGTEIGQLTCCGQNSTLKSTKYVCPSSLPTCNNFKCGSEFGTCTK